MKFVAAHQALRHHHFRRLWLGLALSATGHWFQVVAQSLLVLRLSDGSALALGTVSLAHGLAFFTFVLLGGTLADQMDLRRLLFMTQSANVFLSVLLGLLTATDLITLPLLVAVAFASGGAASVDQPARATLLPALVPKADLLNAVALQTLVFNSAATLGPVLAGWSAESLGLATCFFINAASSMGVLCALVRLPSLARPQSPQPHPWHAFREGVTAIWYDSALLWAFALYGTLLLVGPSPSLLLPLFATQVLSLGDAGLGYLFAAVGAGTVVGAFLTASMGSAVPNGKLLIASLTAWSTALLVLTLSRHMGVSLAALFVWGLTRNGVGMAATTLMHLRTPEAVRGRVMSLNALMLTGGRPLGDFILSTLMALLSIPLTSALSAVVVGSVGVWGMLTRRREK